MSSLTSGQSLEMICKELNKKYKSDFIHSGYSDFAFERIPFSSPKLNFMTHGGVPLGYIIEFSGGENGGKTTTALDLCGQAQKLFKRIDADNPKKVVFVDVENTFNPAWATKMGVDVNDLLVVTPTNQYAEEIFNIISSIIDTGEVGLVILDSLAMLMSSAEFDAPFENKQYGGISIPLTKFCKKLTQLCSKHHCTLVGINQIRENLGSMYGGTTTPGGKCWKHTCTLRLSFQRGRFIDDKNNEVTNGEANPFGNMVNVAIEKTKCCPPNRKIGNYTLRYDKGIDAVSDLIDLCISYNFINQGGAWYSIINPDTGEIMQIDDKPLKFQGKPKLYASIVENESIFNMLNDMLSKEIYKED